MPFTLGLDDSFELIFPKVEFGNTDNLTVLRTRNDTVVGKVKLFRNTAWSVTKEYGLLLRTCEYTLILDYLELLQQYIGKILKIQDQELNVKEVILTSMGQVTQIDRVMFEVTLNFTDA